MISAHGFLLEIELSLEDRTGLHELVGLDRLNKSEGISYSTECESIIEGKYEG
ncbi:MAG: hypothetical protein K6T94_15275 [Paenibacillus sp.]|nr:hypothetical protein [Paenibacillus sp.]